MGHRREWGQRIAGLVMIACCGAASAAVSEATMAELRISAEGLVLAGCSVAETNQVLTRLDDADTQVAVIGTAREAHLSAVAARLSLLEQLRDADDSDRDGLMTQLQAATDDEEAKKLTYEQQIDSLRASLFAGMTEELGLFERTLRPGVSGLPLEYRVLDWDARELRKLGRAVKAQEAADSGHGRMTQQDHDLIQDAEADLTMNYARQRLLADLAAVQAAVDAAVNAG